MHTDVLIVYIYVCHVSEKWFNLDKKNVEGRYIEKLNHSSIILPLFLNVLFFFTDHRQLNKLSNCTQIEIMIIKLKLNMELSDLLIREDKPGRYNK